MKNNYFKTVIVHMSLNILLCLTNTSSKTLHLKEGGVCRKGKRPEKDYFCKKPKHCATFKKSIENGNNPVICSFDRLQPIICCPTTINETSISPENTIKNSDSADKKCRQYSALNISRSQTFRISIVGGVEAKLQEFPHMAILGYGETAEPGKWGCGGSLISELWILTAAHCVENSWGKARWARIGDLNVFPAAVPDNARPKDHRIVKHVPHPDYTPSSRYNDIGLFRLAKNVEFSAYVRPICLNTDPSLTPPNQIATGWGRTGLGLFFYFFNGAASSFLFDNPVRRHCRITLYVLSGATYEATSHGLLKVYLDIVPANQCNNSYFSSDDPQLKFGITADSMICAGSSEGDRDTCVGDSGGPLQVKNVYNADTYTQFGITSFGKFCGDKNTPGVYTRVSRYIPWIEGIVWPKK